MTLYELLTGTFPFPGFSRADILKKIRAGSYSIDFQSLSLSPYCIDFLNHCLRLNPKERASATQLLNHPFLAVEYRLQRAHFKENFLPIQFKKVYTLVANSSSILLDCCKSPSQFLVDLQINEEDDEY